VVLLQRTGVLPHLTVALALDLIGDCAEVEPDGVLAVGGGAGMDCAKLASLSATEKIVDRRSG
jgi:alcohol dehydrogenase class IV